MYDRSYEGQELTFEASGALESASLVMRDRETDSWWSLMKSRAIGGDLEGKSLDELDASEKTQWGDWVSRWPETLVLSVDGIEHVENNPYDNYFNDEDRTFREIEVADARLGPKQSIYAFWNADRPFAVSHDDISGGVILPLPDEPGSVIALWRTPGSESFESSRARILDSGLAATLGDATAVFTAYDAGELGESRSASGFDTYWYTWVLVNPETGLLGP